MVKWLHISDLHFKNNDAYERNLMLTALTKSVGEMAARDGGPDLIFVTGDIAHSGKAAEYQHASAFLNALLAVTRLDKSRMFVIPGNHDIDRNVGRGLTRTLGSEEESVEFFDDSHPQYHFLKLRAFREWHDAYFDGVRAQAARTTCETPQVVTVQDVRVGILPINSAIFCLDDEDHGKLWIGRRCLDTATKQLEALKPDVRIALVHHPLDWLHEVEQQSIRRKLQQNVDYLLHGHLHVNHASAVEDASGTVLYLTAGASYQTRKYPNRFLLGQMHLENGVLVSPLRYEDDAEKWLPDPSLFPEEPHGTRFFKRPASPTAESLQVVDSRSPEIYESVLRIREAEKSMGRPAFAVEHLRRRVVIRRPNAELEVSEDLINVSGAPQPATAIKVVTDAPIEFSDTELRVSVKLDSETIDGSLKSETKDGRLFAVRVGFRGHLIPPDGRVRLDWRCRLPGSVARNQDYWVFPADHLRAGGEFTIEAAFPKEPADAAFFKIRNTSRDQLPLPRPVQETTAEGERLFVYRIVPADPSGKVYVLTWRLEL